ncbi:peptidase S10, serine carboxypeptidase [Paraphysoderma sedebokerense]|nr:peptidase S10, serine carboxypeptidase [Paraphysoderma sedebokerense]
MNGPILVLILALIVATVDTTPTLSFSQSSNLQHPYVVNFDDAKSSHRQAAKQPKLPFSPFLPFVSLSTPPQVTYNDTVELPEFRSKQDYRVWSLPNITLPEHEYHMYSGHIKVDDKNSTEFFMYFENREFKSKDLIIWLNGGPGASSFFGLFTENGPFQFNDEGQIQHNKYGWHKAANVLFLEQPASVGFSYVSNPNNIVKHIEDVADHFYMFAQNFIKMFPEAEKFKWWITGESFGGMYVPHIAHNIVLQNEHLTVEKKRKGFKHIDLNGIAVGNGAYFNQYDIPVNWVDYFETLGLLRNEPFRTELHDLRDNCFNELGDPEKFANGELPNCFKLMIKFPDPQYIYNATNGTTCLSTFYDVRVTECNVGDPTDKYTAFTTTYLNNLDVQLSIHATKSQFRPWIWLGMDVYYNLYWNGDKPSFLLLPDLASKIKVFLYNGDADIICNYVGNEAMLSELSWNGKTGFGSKRFKPFFFKEDRLEIDLENRGDKEEKLYGIYRSARGLTYMRVFEAGHMVPFNQPKGSLEMIKAFVRGRL